MSEPVRSEMWFPFRDWAKSRGIDLEKDEAFWKPYWEAYAAGYNARIKLTVKWPKEEDLAAWDKFIDEWRDRLRKESIVLLERAYPDMIPGREYVLAIEFPEGATACRLTVRPKGYGDWGPSYVRRA